MKKLNREQRARKAELIDQLNSAQEAFADAVAAAVQFVDELHDEAEAYWEDRSEGWQEGDTGQAHADWYEEMGRVSDLLGELTELDQASDLLNELPDEPEQ